MDGATEHESLILFLAGRTQHLSDNKCYFKCPEASEKKKEFHIGNRLFSHSGSAIIKAKFKGKLLTTMLK